MHPGRALAGLVIALLLVGYSKQEADAAAFTKGNACALVSAVTLAKLSPNLSAGHESAVPHPANVSTCVWDDRAHHLPALMLTVAPADPGGVAKGLAQGFANMGYRIVTVKGLGDEAAAAVQTADPKHGLAAAVAVLAVRVGKRQLGFSPMRLTITGPGTPAFQHLKRLATETIAHLK